MQEFYITSDGIKLHAKLNRVGEGKSPLCILIHGFTGHMEEDHIIAAQKAMNEADVSVLRVEMFGHGKSDGEFKDHTLYKWVTNALAVVKYAKELDFVTDHGVGLLLQIVHLSLPTLRHLVELLVGHLIRRDILEDIFHIHKGKLLRAGRKHAGQDSD